MAYFVTGATGFIGRRLIERLLDQRQGTIYVLLRESSRGRLEDLLERWSMVAGPEATDRVQPVIGDLRRPLLGVEKEQVAELRGKVTHFFHLAAVYDMTAPAERNTAVNVGGTDACGRTGARGGRQAPAPRLLDRRRGHLQGRLRRGACSTRANVCPRPITAPSSSPSGSCASSPTSPGACTGRGSWSAIHRPARWTRSTAPTTSSRRSSGCATCCPSGCRWSGWTSATPTSCPSTGSLVRSSTSPTSRTSTARPST